MSENTDKVPQWCKDAAKEIANLPFIGQVISVHERDCLAIIARYAPALPGGVREVIEERCAFFKAKLDNPMFAPPGMTEGEIKYSWIGRIRELEAMPDWLYPLLTAPDGPGEEDGPWSPRWPERSGKPPEIIDAPKTLPECGAELWHIGTAPKDGSFIILFGPSGYAGTPLRAEVGHFVESYNACPWRTHSGDAFEDGGLAPTHWLPLPALPGPTKETNI